MEAYWVPWLHMHQPLVWVGDNLESNLKKMILSKDSKESWDGKLIARAYKNPATYVKKLSQYNPKIVLDFSGILLESLHKLSEFLKEVEIQGEKIGDIIENYRKVKKEFPNSIEFVASAYSHCYFPVTPERDWKWQVREWQNVFSSLFGKGELKKVKGFWLPEMGTPSYGDKFASLIKVLKDFGYEWLILPIFSLKDYEKIGFEERVRIFSRPHKISIKDQEITVVFSAPYYFLDQQAGMNASYVYEQCLKAKNILGGDKPAIIITASDGENGNVMMNQFFPETYTDFFTKFKDSRVSSILVSEFLEKYFKDEKFNFVELKLIGASWIGGHERWIWGEKRAAIAKEIDEISNKVNESGDEELIRLLLIAETSCYVYWGTDYWFDQGKKTMEKIRERLKNISKKI
ncbi:MAG: glycoside hydrolase [Candidatus Aenigmatarchaeota archaeon]